MMRQVLIRAAAIVMAMTVALTPVQAHHSFAMYDKTKTMAKTGVVVRTIPDAWHFQLFFAELNEERTAVIRDAAGEPIIWQIEMETAAIMAGEGVTTETFAPGSIVSIGFVPLRNGNPGGNRNGLGLYKCPPKTPPAAGAHCDSVEGATKHGEGELPVI